MNIVRKTTATLGVTALIAVPTAIVLASPASADVDRQGRCGGATYELNVDRERSGFEIDADIDDAASRSTWRVTLRHDGNVYYNKVRTADREGDLDVERFRSNTAGTDVFSYRVKNTRTGKACRISITRR